jgi:hypothetical protein
VKFRMKPKRGYYTPFQLWKGVIPKPKKRGTDAKRETFITEKKDAEAVRTG